MADIKKYNGSAWEHSLRKLTTATEAVENPLYSDGTSITAYTIKGNTVQNGTPTPSNPVDVNGVGERTENLFGGFDYFGTVPSISTGRDVHFASGASTNFISIGSPVLTLSKNQTYTDANIFIFLYDADKQFIGATAAKQIAIYSTDISGYTDAKYCRIRVDQYAQYGTEYMLNTGSTAKPYEPWGYKIPISNGQQTTNIYLGSTGSTRQIKKYICTGNEQWQSNGVGTNNAFFYIDLAPLIVSYGLSTHFTKQNIWSSNTVVGFGFEGAGILRIRPENAATYTTTSFKQWLADQLTAGTPVTVWYVLATPETGIVNEPLMKIGTYADTLSNATAIPTTEGANSITVDTSVQPSEFTATWTGWHNASVKEYEGGVGNNKFDEQYPDISTTTAYRPIYVGDGTFTMSSTVGREGTSAVLYFLAGNVSTGAHNSTNSVYDGQNRTQTAVDGYVTVAYRYIETLSPENYDTMLSKGSTALPYEPYEYRWE